MNAPAPTNSNGGRSALLNTLASSGNQVVQLGTLALVGVSGLTSFFQTNQVGEQGRVDRDKAIHEIHQLYDKVDDFEARQKKVLENQTRMLENQNGMLNNQDAVLRVLRENQQRSLRNIIPPQNPGGP
jgi:hypothetical protein